MGDRWQNMIERYGSEEAAREEMRIRASKSKRNLGKKGGFASLDKEQLIQVSIKGGKVRKSSAVDIQHTNDS